MFVQTFGVNDDISPCCLDGEGFIQVCSVQYALQAKYGVAQVLMVSAVNHYNDIVPDINVVSVVHLKSRLERGVGIGPHYLCPSELAVLYFRVVNIEKSI